MAVFEYRGLTGAGREMKGTLEAADAGQAREMLTEMGVSVSEIEHVPAPPGPKVSAEDFLAFNQQLSSIAAAGIPLERGLRELARDAGTQKMRTMINRIAGELEQGVPLEEAIGRERSEFPPFYRYVLEAGLKTGRLAEMLNRLNAFLQISKRTRRIIIESLTYPVVVFLLAAVIISGVMLLVIPTFKDILTDMSGIGLPGLTQAVFVASEYVAQFWIVFGCLIALVVLGWYALSLSPAGRRVKEAVLTRIPLLGPVVKSGCLSMLAEIETVLIEANCPLPLAIRTAGAASGSELLRRDTAEIADQIEQGHNLMESGMRCRLIPRLFMYSMQLGTQRNELLGNLQSMAGMYAQRTYSLQNRLQGILIPTMIVAMGLVVALIVVSMFLPMVRIITVLM